MSDILAQKRALRSSMKMLRTRIADAERLPWNRRILAEVLSHPHFIAADTVMAYVSMGSEVDTYQLIAEILAQGKVLLLPRCSPGSALFEPAIVTRLELDLVPGPMPGLLDPKAGLPVWPRNTVIPLILTPGLAFDHRNQRLGYGKGMYDRFFQNWKIGHAMGLAFQLQRQERIPSADHDVPLDSVLTEAGCYHVSQ